MSSRFLRLATVASLASLLSPVSALAFDPNYIISDHDFTNKNALSLSGVSSFLTNRFLGSYSTIDYAGIFRPAAEIIWNAAQDHGVNPMVLLVMLQKEQSLIVDDTPSQKQLDWAMGYAVCDSCSMTDSTIGRWRGFGKQVNSAAMQLTDGYLADIASAGKTAGKYGPGVPVEINDTIVIPQNAATAALYAYTPHLHGNELFSKLWDQWFSRKYPSGTLVQVPGEKTVWLIENDVRRSISSQAVLASRFNTKLVIPISTSELATYQLGAPISLPNYSLVRSPDGDIFLVVGDNLRRIESLETFRKLGFSTDELVDVSEADINAYGRGEEITLKTTYAQGRLFKLPSGALFFVENGTRYPVRDQSVITARWGAKAPVAPMSVAQVESLLEGPAITLPDGTLIKTAESPAVYVISNQLRRNIPDEATFLSYGYQWSNIITVPESVMKLHKDGEPLQNPTE